MTKYLILILIFLFLFYYIRTLNYNNYLNKINVEEFSQENTKKNYNLDLPANPNMIFVDFYGNTYLIKSEKVWIINSEDKIFKSNEFLYNVFNLPTSTIVKTGCSF